MALVRQDLTRYRNGLQAQQAQESKKHCSRVFTYDVMRVMFGAC